MKVRVTVSRKIKVETDHSSSVSRELEGAKEKLKDPCQTSSPSRMRRLSAAAAKAKRLRTTAMLAQVEGRGT